MTQPSPADLSQLRIDRSIAPVRRSRRRRWLVAGVLAVAGLAVAGWYAQQPRVVAVADGAGRHQRTRRSSSSVLNATGYVVAQRKAAIASKATGRLEWLGVAEGLARQGRRGDRAPGQSRRRRAGDSGDGERPRCPCGARAGPGRGDATRSRSVARATSTWSRRASSRRPRSTRRRRAHDRAVAGVASARAAIGVAEANARNAQVAVDYTQIRAPVRRRGPVEERERRRRGDAVLAAADSKGAVVTMADMTRSRSKRTSPSRISPRSRSASPARSSSTRCRMCACSGKSAWWCRPSTARRRRDDQGPLRLERDPRVLPEMSARWRSCRNRRCPRSAAPLQCRRRPRRITQRDGHERGVRRASTASTWRW
jgi:HlyD family secretion protein